jgi:2-C-methyl-D-erythritol 2,4-cyclodiphosphate synthase
MNFRIGQGVDIHRFCEGDYVMLGGVRIDHSQSLAAHSDGDVALHALCDAMLGAAAQGDIGRHFPPGDPEWKGVDSRELLRKVNVIIKHEGWEVANADITIICEQPKITAHAELMQTTISADLGFGVNTNRISVKATTTEGMGFCGRGEGIEAHAIVMLTRW